MKIISQGDTLNVSGIPELAAGNSGAFQEQLCAALPDGVKHIEIDLSQTAFVDCGGVGALVGLRNSARDLSLDVTIRLLNPTGPVKRIFNLTRMNDLFPIVTR